MGCYMGSYMGSYTGSYGFLSVPVVSYGFRLWVLSGFRFLWVSFGSFTWLPRCSKVSNMGSDVFGWVPFISNGYPLSAFGVLIGSCTVSYMVPTWGPIRVPI